jgi:tetratricopeptide (TPR) repeat protein
VRWFVLLILLAGCGNAIDLEQARRFDEANAAQRDGDPAKAAAIYETLLDEGVESGAIYYNLGNSYQRAGRRGEAIAAYRQALRYRPNDPYLKANLANAVNEREIESRTLVDHLLFWQRWLSWPGKWRALAVSAFVAFLLGLAAQSRRALRPFAWLSLAVTLLLAVSVALAWNDVIGTTHGVVKVKSVVARKGDAESYAPAFTEPLDEGTEFTVLDRRGDWIHIRLENLEGWIPVECGSYYPKLTP